MSRYIVAPQARDDLREIQSYYLEEGSASGARTVLGELRAAFQRLAKNPGIGHSRPDLTDRRIRFWPVRSYLVVYRPETKPLEIITVLHGARDVQRILQGR